MAREGCPGYRSTAMMSPAVEERRVAQLVPLPSDEPGDQWNLEAKPSGDLIHDHPPSIIRPPKSRVAWQGPLDQHVRSEGPLCGG
jgi:hypothetical protein